MERFIPASIIPCRGCIKPQKLLKKPPTTTEIGIRPKGYISSTPPKDKPIRIIILQHAHHVKFSCLFHDISSKRTNLTIKWVKAKPKHEPNPT
jgi:hypothetical protein